MKLEPEKELRLFKGGKIDDTITSRQPTIPQEQNRQDLQPGSKDKIYYRFTKCLKLLVN